MQVFGRTRATLWTPAVMAGRPDLIEKSNSCASCRLLTLLSTLDIRIKAHDH